MMSDTGKALSIENVFSTACSLPYCQVQRESFLRQELANKISADQLAVALESGTLKAGIPIEVLNRIAIGSIDAETTKVTLLSAASGIPGGLAMVATIPADLAQFYAHVFRIVQKLAYIYGDLAINLNEGLHNSLMVYLGVMFGVQAANAALIKLAANNAAKIGARVAAKPLTRITLYKVARFVLKWAGVKLTKDMVGKTVSKSIPIIGGLLSGAITFAAFRPMAFQLQGQLAKNAQMSPDELSLASAQADEVLRQTINENSNIGEVTDSGELDA